MLRVHLKDADTLREIYLKERWRGADSVITSFRRLSENPDSILSREMVSLALPFYFLTASLFFDFGLVTVVLGWNDTILWTACFAMALPILFLSYRTALKSERLDSFPALFAVYAAYITGRSNALFDNISNYVFAQLISSDSDDDDEKDKLRNDFFDE